MEPELKEKNASNNLESSFKFLIISVIKFIDY